MYLRPRFNFGVKFLLLLMLAIGVAISWWQLRSTWEGERTREALNARPNEDGTGHELYVETITVYEDRIGREIPAPPFSRRTGCVIVGFIAAVGLGTLGEGLRWRSRSWFNAALVCLLVVVTIMLVELSYLTYQFALRFPHRYEA